MLFDPTKQGDERDLNYCRHHILERFRRSPKEFYDYHLGKTLPSKEPSAEMRIGTAADIRLLTSDTDKICVIPDKLTRSTSKKSLADKEIIKSLYTGQGITWLTESESARVDAIVDSAKKELGNFLAKPYEAQKQVSWVCPVTQWPKRGTLDYFSEEVVLDIKTTSPWNMRSPHTLSKWVYDCGYHRQLAFYEEGLLVNIHHKRPMKLVFIGNDVPYETVIVNIQDPELEIGHFENNQTIVELSERYAANNWGPRFTSFDVKFPEWVYQ